MSDDIKVTDGTILEALNGKIDYDGGNYLGSGLEEVVNNYLAENTGSGLDNKITNCLLEVPQKIKYTLENGTLTIKAGSIIIVPYGTTDRTSEFPVGATFIHENLKVYDTQFVDGKFFVWAQLVNDVSRAHSTTDSNTRFITFYMHANSIDGAVSSASGTSITTSALFYNTSTNLVEYLTNGVNTDNNLAAFPLGISKANGTTKFASINQVFNGMGYIGSTVWVDKGVKGLIPNGRNEDGSLKNVEWISDKLYSRTFTHNVANGVLGFNPNLATPIQAGNITYNEVDNYQYSNSAKWTLTAVGTCTLTNGVISNFQPKQPFRAVDYNDKSEIISWGMPDYNSGIAISQLFTADTSYTAPSDGVIVMLAYKTGSAVEFYINGIKTPYSIRSESQWVGNKSSITIPISKGDVIYCSQTANSSVKESTFYPLKGVK